MTNAKATWTPPWGAAPSGGEVGRTQGRLNKLKTLCRLISRVLRSAFYKNKNHTNKARTPSSPLFLKVKDSLVYLCSRSLMKLGLPCMWSLSEGTFIQPKALERATENRDWLLSVGMVNEENRN